MTNNPALMVNRFHELSEKKKPARNSCDQQFRECGKRLRFNHGEGEGDEPPTEVDVRKCRN